MRTFNGKPIELLAPAGNFDIFEGVVKTTCDAIYFGGQTLNMRMIRKGFNFTDAELKKAVDLAHRAGKKAYITVNNLVDQNEIEMAKVYLRTLADIKPDALIIQDLGIARLIKALDLPLELHASVMMNVHNSSMVNALKHHGVTRVVLSRELSLEDAKRIYEATGVEIEYFTHGDMCVAHGASCYYSSMLFGMSSNRGKCLKPCRWWFNPRENSTEKSFPMAVKDLSLYTHLPEMIGAGITSFKIEGRMREKTFITNLINTYGDALDRYIADSEAYNRLEGYDQILDNRKRDLSTGYAFGNPGADNMNERWEGTGKFYSTGKMFSVPTEERGITQDLTEKISTDLKQETCKSVKQKTPGLSMKVQTYDQACAAIDAGVDRLYLTMETFKPHSNLTINQIRALSEGRARRAEIYIATPRMTTDEQIVSSKQWLLELGDAIDGVMIGNLGALVAYQELNYPMLGDYSLNVMNSEAVGFYQNEGLQQVTASLELSSSTLGKMLINSDQIEVVVYGNLPAMYFEHDFYKALEQNDSEPLILYNEAGAYHIYKDGYERNHLLTQTKLNLLPFISEFDDLGVAMIRIEAQTETPEDIATLIALFRKELSGNGAGEQKTVLVDGLGYTYGALTF